MLEDIGNNYEVLSDVTEDFKPLLSRPPDLGIVSFIEDDASNIRGSLVRLMPEPLTRSSRFTGSLGHK
jgi:hypothetical protein